MNTWRERNDAVEAALTEARPRAGVGRVRIECPFCISSKTLRADASMSVDPLRGFYHCHRCGTGGRLRGEQYMLLDETVWTPRCAGQIEIPLDENGRPPRWRVMPEGYVPLYEGPWAGTMMVEEATRYAASRGIDAELGAELGVGACLTGWYAGYLIFPCVEPGFGPWGWVARNFDGHPRVGPDGQPRKYLYPREMPRGEFLAFGEILTVETDVPVLYVEGYLDAVAHRPHAVPTLGKFAARHHERIARSPRPKVFFADGDAWEEAMWMAAQYRLLGHRAGYIRIPPKTDPDEVPHDWAMEEAHRCLERGLSTT